MKGNSQKFCSGSDDSCGSTGRRLVDVIGWILPSAILVLIPKCPVCVAAYVALWTGIGISVAAAANLRVLLIVVCLISLVLLTARQTRRLIVRPHASLGS